MSFLRTLQMQPRVITLFSPTRAFPMAKLFTNNENNSNPEIEIRTTFPTLDQLQYMNEINPKLLKKCIPTKEVLLRKDSFESVFGSELLKSQKNGDWNNGVQIWVDWEKKKMGNDIRVLQSLLKK